MKEREEACRARKLRLEAARRLIQHQHTTPPEHIEPKKPKQPTRRMVPPAELSVKIVTA